MKKKNPKVKLGDAMKAAKKTYKKGKMSGGADEGGVQGAPALSGPFTQAAPAGGRRHSRRGRKTRRGTRRH